MNLRLLISVMCGLAMALASGKAPAGAPSRSWAVETADMASVKLIVTEHPSDPLMGIWRTTADGASIAVIPGSLPDMPRNFSDTYLLVIMRSPRIGIPAGTVMGWCVPAAKKGYYDSYIFTRCDGKALSSPRRFTMHLADGSHLSMTVVHDGIEVQAWRLLPYMFRRIVRERHDRPRDLDGMLRVWPVDYSDPVAPRYL